MGFQTERFARFFADLSLESVPAEIQSTAQCLILDTLGCAAAAVGTQPQAAIDHIARLFGGDVGGRQIGHAAGPVGVMRAIYANARLANLLDYDETYPVGVHFGNAAVMAAIAAAQCGGRNSRDLLIGAIAGYEAGARLASSVGPMMRIRDDKVIGFSQIWGVAAPVVLAACVAYGRTLGISSDVMHQAIGIAVSNIPLPIGNKWSHATDLPDVKYCDAGWCSVAGAHGVHSALAGLSGFSDALDGPVGVPEAYGAAMADHTILHSQLGERWHLKDMTFKPWPSCRFMHPPLTALARILEKAAPAPDAITEIEIQTGPLANSSRFRNPEPKTFCSFQFSYPHVVAMMVLGVAPGRAWFDPEIAEQPAARALRARTKIVLHSRSDSFVRTMVDNQIRTMPGGAIVRTADHTWHEEADYAKGDPWDDDTRFTANDVIAKFQDLCGNHDRGQKLIDWLHSAHQGIDLEPLNRFMEEV